MSHGHCIEVNVRLGRPTMDADRTNLLRAWGDGLNREGLLLNPIMEFRTLLVGTPREFLSMRYQVPAKPASCTAILAAMQESLTIHGFVSAELEVIIHRVEYVPIEVATSGDNFVKGALAA